MSSHIWFDQPADDWHAALPVGNGKLGAMLFGGCDTEHVQLTEESIWAGPPVPEMPDTAAEAVKEARQLIFAGDYVKADQLVDEKVLGEFPATAGRYLYRFSCWP